MIVDAKCDRDRSISKDSIAQVIGYFIASKCSDHVYQLLGLILTQSKAQFLFFPYRDGDTVYVDAIVTKTLTVTKQWLLLPSSLS